MHVPIYSATHFSGRHRFNLTEGEFNRGFSGGPRSASRHRRGSGASLTREPRSAHGGPGRGGEARPRRRQSGPPGRRCAPRGAVGALCPPVPPRKRLSPRGLGWRWGSRCRQPLPLEGSQAGGVFLPHPPPPPQVQSPSQQGSLRLVEFLGVLEPGTCLRVCLQGPTGLLRATISVHYIIN